MTGFKKGIALVLTGAFVAAALASIAYPQGAATLVQIITGSPATTVSASNPLPVSGTFAPTSGTAAALSHASTTAATATSLVAKASAGNLYGFNCTGVAGGAAGYCVAYNGSSAPGAGALTGTLVLDFCYFDTTARGCSLSRIPLGVQYSTGIVLLVTSATTPYTYTTGTDTAAISVDYK